MKILQTTPTHPVNMQKCVILINYSLLPPKTQTSCPQLSSADARWSYDAQKPIFTSSRQSPLEMHSLKGSMFRWNQKKATLPQKKYPFQR